MRKAIQGLALAAFYLMSLLPYRALYALSDFLYVIVYRLVRYRLSTVRRNMAAAFPDKTADGLRRLDFQFGARQRSRLVEGDGVD